MFLYADPRACPGCRAPIPYGASGCPSCNLGLTGEEAQRLFVTLTEADALIAAMRTAQALAVREEGHVAGVDRPASAAPPPRSPSPRLTAASVPRILLGLGALCLLVAALVFLAVAWTALGVGGRTGVLAGLTATSGAIGVLLARRDLRAGAEAFAAVSLGLLVLDLAGAESAGWLGDLGTPGFLVLVGCVLTPVSLVAGVGARRTPVGVVATAEVAAGLGAFVAGLGFATSESLALAPGTVVALVTAALVAALAWSSGLRIAVWAAGAAALLWWATLVLLGLARLADERTLASVWGDLESWPLLVAAGAAGALAALRPLPQPCRVAAASAAVAVAAHVVCFPAFDESATRVSLVELAVVAVAGAMSVRLPTPWRWVTAAPSLAAGIALAVSAARLLAEAVRTLFDFTPWRADVTEPLPAPDVPWTWPLLLPLGALGAAVAAGLVARCLAELPVRRAVWWFVPLALVTSALAPILYAVPLWAALVFLVLAASGGLALAAYVRRLEPLAGAALLLALALAASAADEWTTAIALAALATAGLVAVLRGQDTAADAGAAVFVAAAGGFLWTIQTIAAVDTTWRALPILVLVGGFAIVRPGPAAEVPAGLVGGLAVVGSVTASGLEQGWLAAYLTLGGVLATVSALVHPDRRRLAWVGGGLLTLAQWVRLEQLGVDVVEAYTLPLASVLLTVGVVRMVRSDLSSLPALGAGLTLGLVPTLLHVLIDPVSLRALLLGLASVALVLAGVRLRWAAPLLAGAGVGAVVVVREAAHASVLPQWVVIGAIGLTLTALGVTWEQRLAELRRAAGYVRALR